MGKASACIGGIELVLPYRDLSWYYQSDVILKVYPIHKLQHSGSDNIGLVIQNITNNIVFFHCQLITMTWWRFVQVKCGRKE